MEKISGVYKIVNTVTGDSYIGSSRDVRRRWKEHKCPSRWKEHPNNPMYKDMQKYGVDKFRFQIIISIMPECLRGIEQDCIDLMKPTYNSNNAKGWDVERYKKAIRKAKKKYELSEKGKKAHRKAVKKYQQTEKGKEAQKKYNNQLCFYNGETLTLNALTGRFQKAGIPHATLEAKKYLINRK